MQYGTKKINVLVSKHIRNKHRNEKPLFNKKVNFRGSVQCFLGRSNLKTLWSRPSHSIDYEWRFI